MDETVNIRHILIKFDEDSSSSSSSSSSTPTAAQKKAAKKKIDDINAKWTKGAKTESAFAALANENTDDTGSNANGGLYQNVTNGQMVEAFNKWIFDSSRKPGDTGIVESTYGYHLIYFVGKGSPKWYAEVLSVMQSDSFNKYSTDLNKKAKVTEVSKNIQKARKDILPRLITSSSGSNTIS